MKRKCLAVGIILLFVATGIIPSTAQDIEKSQSASRGNWLYVGGSGPGNYTKIQDAINDSSNGDTVFVYSGIYYENIIINKTGISLIGEDKYSTIIDGKREDDTIWIRASFVKVSGFTIVNCSTEGSYAGILVLEEKWWEPSNPPYLSDINISDCIIKNNRCGIRLYSVYATNVSSCIIHNNSANGIYVVASSHINMNRCEITHNGDIYIGGVFIKRDDTIGISDYVSISNCSISYNFWSGIYVMEDSQNIEFYHNNIFENTNYGILVSESNAKIYGNHIYNNGIGGFLDGGILLQDCTNNITVYDNNIETNNQYGLYLLRSSANSITKNNFIQNKYNAYFLQFSLFNHWNGNYWTDWVGLGPKLIKGKLGEVFVPWVNFDWRPAQEPYDIPGTK
ncbi:MAG: right-handed parallel beta-helix repeat-containing protein [Thermoplasmata archaeon]|nr:right-handed parallel beta-helix repeat-containing protein [Thermoplasmata archaeon]